MKHFKLSVTMLSAVSVLSALCLIIIGCGENTAGPSDPFDLWYSQQNESIIFLSRAHSSEGELYLLNKSGEITRLTYNSRHENNPAISRDGSQVAYLAGDESNMTTWEIYVMDIGSGAEHLLMLIPENGGSGQQLIPDGDHTGTMEFFDW